MRKPLKDRPNGQMEYLLKRIPLKLWKDCQEKAYTQDPPVNMRWVILTLLEKFRRDKVVVRKAEALGGVDTTVGLEPFIPKPPRPYKPKNKPPTPRQVGRFTLKRIREAAKARRLRSPDLGEMF